MKAVLKPARLSGANPSADLQVPSATEPSTAICPTTIEMQGVSIHFPFKPYACQEKYMEQVLNALNQGENALLESPTGTGKTLCLLCATLAWQREQSRLLQHNATSQVAASQLDSSSSKSEPSPSRRRVPTILYASRTHSQLSQVVRELRNTRYRPKHAVLGSREQMCVHPKVKTATATAWDINQDCQKLNKERKCRYRNQLEGFQPDANVRGEGTMVQPVLDMEDLVTMGKMQKVCPFYYTRSLVSDAELILIPYNYLFDKDARESTLVEVPWDNAVVVFDEAHNLESFASESASFDLTTLQVAGCVSEVTKTIHYVESNPGLADSVSVKDLVRLKALFLNIEEYMLQGISPKQSVYSGEYMMEILTKGMSINHANHTIFLSEVAKVTDLLLEMRGSSSTTKSSGSPQLESFAGCIKRVFGESTESRCYAKAQSYRVHVTAKQSGAGRTVSYWCFAPSLAMHELSNLNIRSILVTSGTLSPLPSYSMELGLPFPHTLENPHIICEEQIHVRVIGHGVSGKVLTSSYQRRDDAEYILELGNSLVSLARIVPGGMLVFFPSYGVMETCVERWGGPSSRKSYFASSKTKNNFFQARYRKGASSTNQYSFPHAPDYYARASDPSTPWKRMLCQKAIVLEPRSTADLSDAISEFQKFLDRPKSTGCILMGVCRGKISEGIDFRDNMCRAVVITGLPFAPYLDPKVKLKREYLDGLRAAERVKASGDGGFGDEGACKAVAVPVTLSGAEWYTQQAHRAVNQAIGRVIRNKTDYGAVLLLDSRFGETRNQQGLSKWVRPHVQGDSGFGMAVRSLAQFFQDAQRKEKELVDAACPGRRKVEISYENEKPSLKLNQNTEIFGHSAIAIVQSRTSDWKLREKDPSSTQDSSGFIPPSQIVAHVNLKDVEPPKPVAHVKNIRHEHETPVHGLEALYHGKDRKSLSNSSRDSSDVTTDTWAGLGAVLDKRRGGQPPLAAHRPREAARPAISNGSNKKNNAALFFQKAKAVVSSEDLLLIRNAVVDMKGFGEKRDVTAYRRAARCLVDILLRYENFDVQHRIASTSMLELFYSLLPYTFRGDMKKIAVRMNFQRSEFVLRAKTILNPDEGTRFISSVEDLLLSIYCRDPSLPETEAITSTAYVRETRSVMQVIVNHESRSPTESSKPSLVKLFLRLVPGRFKSVTYAMVESLKSAKSVQALKKSEKTNTGEKSVDPRLFTKPQAAPKKPVPKEDASPNETDTRKTMEAALMRAEELNRAKRERLQAIQQPGRLLAQRHNPYTRRSNRTASSTLANLILENHSLPTSELSRPTVENPPLPTSDISRPAKRLRRPPINSPPSSDPLFSALREAERRTFVDRRSGNAGEARKIKSNLPPGFACNICEKPPKQVFLATCGHTACSKCWSKWLQKSRTCPHCRRPVEKNQLERVVFESEAGAGAPTLSQLYPRQEEAADLSSEDEELELVQD